MTASATAPRHTFYALAFVENLSLKDLAPAFENARRTPHELRYVLPDGRGRVFMYPFGVIVFHDVSPADREAQLARLRVARPGLTATPGGAEEFHVRATHNVDAEIVARDQIPGVRSIASCERRPSQSVA